MKARNLEEEVLLAIISKVEEDCKRYKMMPGIGLTASVPLTRRERRASKRKEKKHGNTK